MRWLELDRTWDDAVDLILLHELISKYESCAGVLQVANTRGDSLEVVFDYQSHFAKEYSSILLLLIADRPIITDLLV